MGARRLLSRAATRAFLLVLLASLLVLLPCTGRSRATAVGVSGHGETIPQTSPTPLAQNTAPDRIAEIGELREARTANSETYLLSDGSKRLRIYPGPVRFKDRTGDWHAYDTSLVADQTFGTFHAASTPFDISIGSDANDGAIVTMESEGQYLTIDLLGVRERNPLVLGDQASYLVDEQVSVAYAVRKSGLEQTVILASAAAPDTFTCLISHPGLSMRQDRNNQWAFFQPGDPQPVFCMSDLVVFDSSSDEAGDPAYCASAKMSVEVGDQESRLTYHVPRSWLEDPMRAYPVKLDPTWYGRNPSQDTWLGAGAPNLSHGGEAELRSGRQPAPSAGYDRSLVQFDVSAIPANSRITYGRVQVYRFSLTGEEKAVYVGQVRPEVGWSGGSTWNGLGFAAGYPQNHINGLGQGWWKDSWLMLGDYDDPYVRTPVIRRLVHDWRYGGVANQGFAFYQSESSALTYLNKYRSVDAVGYESRFPYLEVYYENPTAQLQSYQTAYRIGQDVTVAVRAAGTTDYAAVRQIELGINWTAAASSRRGVFGYFAYDPGGLWVHIGNGFYYYNDPAGHGSDKTTLLSGSYDGGTGTATFTFRINDNYGDLQDNDFDTYLSMTSEADPSGVWSCTDIVHNDTNIDIMPKASPAPSVIATGSSGWFREADRNGDGKPDSGSDHNDAGRGHFTLQWPTSPLADRYYVYLWDGGPYDAEASWHKVGETVGNDATTWRSAGFGGYPADSTITSWSPDYSANPYLCTTSPSQATKLTDTPNDPNPLIPADASVALDGCGVVVCDGHYGYVLRWGTSAGPERWTKVDLTAIDTETDQVPVLRTVGPPQQDMRSAFLLDGYIYGGRVTAINGEQATLKGVWKGASSDSTASKTLTLSKRPLLRTSGAEVSGATGDLLLACDGERIYSAGRLGDTGYRIYEYAIDGSFVSQHDVSCPSGDVRGLIADGSGLILICWSATNNAPVTRISTANWTMTNCWTLDQGDTKVINGCFDPVERVLWLGTYSTTAGGHEGKLYRYGAPGLDLRDRAHSLYLKTDGSEGDSQQGYSFRIVPYSDETGRLPVLVNARNNPLLALDNRTLTVAEAPRHTAYALGQFADHTSEALLDEGALQTRIDDLTIASFGPAASLTRTYRSDRTNAELHAPGWRFGFERCLRFDWTPGNNEDPTSVWKSQSGAGPDFTLANVAYTTASGWAGSGTPSDPHCFTSDAANDTVSNGSGAFNLGSGARTISVWARLNSYRSADEGIAGNMAVASPHRGWGMYFDGNRHVQAWVSQDIAAGQFFGAGTNSSFAVGEWHHFVFVYAGATSAIYVDGTANYGNGGTPGAWNADTAQAFTVAGPCPLNGWSGAVSVVHLQVYNRALSPAEVSGIYGLGKNAVSGWPTNGLIASLAAAQATNDRSVAYVDENGDEHRFLLQNGSWQAPNGLVASLVDEGDTWKLTFKDRRALVFRESNGSLAAEIDANGNQTSYDYANGDLTIGAANGQQIAVDLDGGKIASASYQVSIGGQTKERRVAFSASAPWTATSSFWNAGQEETDLRRVVQYAYEGDRLSEIKVTSANDAHVAFAYANGKLSRVEQPDYHTCPDAYAAIAYDTDGARTAIITRRGEIGGAVTNVMQHFAWNPTGTLALRGNPTTEGTYASWTYAYSGDNQTIREIPPGGSTAKHRGWAYDARGNLIAEYDEQKERTRFAYAIDDDIFDERIRSVDPRGCTTTYDYDDDGNLLWQERELTEGDDPQKARTEYDYDDVAVGGAQYKGALIEQRRKISEGAWAETDYAQHAANGEPQQTIDRAVRLSAATTQDLMSERSYDSFGNLTSETNAAGETIAANSYDLTGRLLTSTDAADVVTHHVYNNLGEESESWRTHQQTQRKIDWIKYQWYEGQTTRAGHDPLGRTIEEQKLIDRMDLIVPLEMNDSTLCATETQRDAATSLIYLDPADYDGATYYLEIVALNTDALPHSVKLLDASNDVVLTSVRLSGETYYHTRLRSAAFAPKAGANKLCLRLPTMPAEEDLKVFSARIIVEQHNATRTRLQFPLLAGPWATEGWYGDAPDDAYIAYMDGAYYAVEDWYSPFWQRQDELLASQAPGAAWTLETVQAHDAGGASYACLYNASDDELIPASEIVRSADSYDLATADFAGNATHFENGDSYRLMCKSDGSGQFARIARAALYVELDDLSRAAVYWRVGNADWSHSDDEQIMTQRMKLDLSAYSGQPSCYFETSAVCADAQQRVHLCDAGSADTGTGGWSDVAGLGINSSTRTRVRSNALTLQDGHRYTVRWDATTAEHQPMAHFLIVDVQSTTRVQSTVRHSYDGMGFEVGSNDSAIGGLPAKVEYDARGNQTQSWEEGSAPAAGGGFVEAASTRVEYDELDQVEWEDEPGDTVDEYDDEFWEYEYDEEGMLTEEDEPEGPINDPAIGPVVQYEYTSGDELEVVTEPQVVNGSDAKTASRYDLGGRLVWQQNPDGTVSTYQYDLLDRQTQVQLYADEQLGTPLAVTTTTYNAAGWVLAEESSSGVDVLRSYDAAGRTLTETRDGQLTTWSYDDAGRLAQQLNPEGTKVGYTYDPFGRTTLLEQRNAANELSCATATRYDSLGRELERRKDSGQVGGRVRTTRDYADSEDDGTDSALAYGSIATAIDNNAREKEDSRSTTTGAGQLVRSVTARDTADRAIATALRLGDGEALSFARLFDAAGRISSVSGAGYSAAGSYLYNCPANPQSGLKGSQTLPLAYPAGEGIDLRFVYDINGRLQDVKTPADTTIGHYAFDGSGNITEAVENGTATEFFYEAGNQLDHTTTGAQTTEYDRDGQGRRTFQGPAGQARPIAFTYTDSDRLASYADSSRSVSATYSYDAEGQRERSFVVEPAGTTTTDYLYDGLTLLSLAATSNIPTQAPEERHNLLSCPSFEIDEDEDAVADGWEGDTDSDDPTPSLVSGRGGGLAQRVVGSFAGGSYFMFYHSNYVTEGIAGGQQITFSGYYQGTISGLTMEPRLYCWDAAENQLGYLAGDHLASAATWTRFTLSATTLANTAKVKGYMHCTNVAGNSFDIVFDDFMVERSDELSSYFDGDSLNASWDGEFNASSSTLSGAATAERHNLLPYPSFEYDADSDGRSEGVYDWGDIAGEATYTMPSGRLDGVCQRVQYTGLAADSGAELAVAIGDTEAGSLDGGQPLRASVYVKGSVAGASLSLITNYLDAQDEWLAWDFKLITLTGSWQRVNVGRNALPAGADRCQFWLSCCDSLDEGDTLDISFDDALVETAEPLGSSFDGDSQSASWDGEPDASTSTRAELPADDARNWQIDYLYDEESRPYAGIYREGSAEPLVFALITTDRGDVVELLDSEGEAFAAYRYNEWGVPLAGYPKSRGTAEIPAAVAARITARQVLRYAGYVYDADSGLYYCSTRHYDPATCQFISHDSAKADGEQSAYQYCGGDPIGRADPSGTWSLESFCREWLPGYAFLLDLSRGKVNATSLVEGAAMLTPPSAVASRFGGLAARGIKRGVLAFWSGPGTKKAALDFVKSAEGRALGATTILDTPVGKNLERAESFLKRRRHITDKTARLVMHPFWCLASRTYARRAKEAIVFHNWQEGVYRKSVWVRWEYPQLKKRKVPITYINIPR